MVVQFRRSSSRLTSPVLPPDPPDDPLADLLGQLDELVQRFRNQPLTPQSLCDLEKALQQQLQEVGRVVLPRELNRLEPDEKTRVPPKVRYHKQTYRLNKKTTTLLATRFGTISLRSFYYLNQEDGEPGLPPLHVQLGLNGTATPGFLQRVARVAVDHTQREVRQGLLQEHGLTWSNDRLRTALREYRQAILPFVPGLQKARLLGWLVQAQNSRGRHRPVLVAGRDGIMVPLRKVGKKEHYQEASTATVSVYDRRRRRLGTVYLGQMPEAKQKTLTEALTALLTEVLTAWEGPVPRLAYVTDKGKTQDRYYRKVLRKMKNPHKPKRRLPWEWVLDFFHVCGYVSKMAVGLYGVGSQEGEKWSAKMRKWLRERRQGVAHLARSARQLLEDRKAKMTKAEKADFYKGYRYIRRHRKWMKYAEYKRQGLPIGSGVTEAACKTVFTQRFKRSGMRWKKESGQVILDLRVAYLSGIWEEAHSQDIASRILPEALWSAPKQISPNTRSEKRSRFAA